MYIYIVVRYMLNGLNSFPLLKEYFYSQYPYYKCC